MRKKELRGISIIELLIAIMIISIGITGATSLAMGGQESIRDAGLSHQALYKVDGGLENVFASLKNNWNSLTATVASSDGIYTKSTEIYDVSPCMKQVTSFADWSVPQRSQLSSIISLFTDPEEVRKYGGNCNTTPASGDWDFPQSYGSVGFTSSNGIHGRDIDVAYVNSKRVGFLAGAINDNNKEDFAIIDLSTPASPSVVSGSELNIGGSLGGNSNGRINALVYADNYVYALSSKEKNSPTELIFTVIDVSTLSNPVVVATTTLSGETSNNIDDGVIAYYDSNVYVGTGGTTGPEFHVFDVSTPTNPSEIVSASGAPVELGSPINDLIVRNGKAYVASSSDTSELIVLDISDPYNIPDPITLGTTYDVKNVDGVTQSDRDGTSIYVSENRAYLGTVGSGTNNTDGHEFFILDISDDDNISLLGSKDLNLKTSEEVVGISTIGPLAFIVSTDTNVGFQVWNIGDPSNIISPSSCNNLYNYPEKPTSLDFLDNYGFVSNDSNEALRVIYDDPSCVPSP